MSRLVTVAVEIHPASQMGLSVLLQIGHCLRIPREVDPVLKDVYTVHMPEKRDQILACACDLYLSEGLEGFSMRKLAKALDVTAPALYRHYESKERVLLDVVGEAYRILIQLWSKRSSGIGFPPGASARRSRRSRNTSTTPSRAAPPKSALP